MIKMKCVFAMIALILLAICCKQKKDPYANTLGIQPSTIAQIDTANYTTIQFEDSIKNVGTVHSGDTVNIQFKFTNSGDKPLYLSSVTPGCGCTIVDYPKGMIPGGEKGIIQAKLGTETLQGDFHKTIGVISNTRNARMHTLVFYGSASTDSTSLIK